MVKLTRRLPRLNRRRSNRRRSNRKRLSRSNRRRINRRRTNRRRSNRRRTNRRKIMIGGSHGESDMGPTQYGKVVSRTLKYAGVLVWPIAQRIWDSLAAGGTVIDGDEWVDTVANHIGLAKEQGVSGADFEGWFGEQMGV